MKVNRASTNKFLKRLVELFFLLFLSVAITACELPEEDDSGDDTEETTPGDDDGFGNGPPFGGNPDGAYVCRTDSFRQDDAVDSLLAVDIVFVMDTSGSMSDEWDKVADNMETLLNEIPDDVSVNYAVINARVDNKSGTFISGTGESKIFNNQEYTKDEIKAQLRAAFEYASAFGARGNDGETTFYSLHESVTTKLAENQALGFYRPDAALSIIFVSDENEIGSPVSEHQIQDLPEDCGSLFERRYVNLYRDNNITTDSVFAKLKQVKGDMPMNAHAFVNITAEDLDVRNDLDESCLDDSLGYGYFEMVEKSGGVLFSLHSSRSDGMRQVGEHITRSLTLTYDFHLSGRGDRIDPDTIQVRVDGTDTEEFTYDSSIPSIHLEDAGDALSLIEVYYCEFADWAIENFSGNPDFHSVTLTWQTGEKATKAKIKYGLSADALVNELDTTIDSNNHSVLVGGLEQDTVYYFQLDEASDDEGFHMPSEVISVRTKKEDIVILPPVWDVENINTNADYEEVDISWTTRDVLTQARVRYGISATDLAFEISIDEAASSHELTVSGLEQNTEYFFQITGVDGHGLEHTSSVFSVKTKFDEPVPPQEWEIIGLDGTTRSNSIFVIWRTEDADTRGRILIGLSPNDLSHAVMEVDGFSRKHVHEVTGLSPNTRYYIQVVAEDSDGQEKESNIISKKTKN